MRINRMRRSERPEKLLSAIDEGLYLLCTISFLTLIYAFVKLCFIPFLCICSCVLSMAIRNAFRVSVASVNVLSLYCSGNPNIR